MSELKPCPFCGGEAHITLEQAMWFIECENEDCGAMMGFEAEKVSQEEAISAWNRRAQPDITGETSDGYHTFNELYHHRAVLFSVICNSRPDIAWRAKRHHDGTMYNGMFIVGINTPDGQATYHYDVDPYWEMFRVPELLQAPEWDGHTPAQAIERIWKLSAQPDNEPLTLEQVVEKRGEPLWYRPIGEGTPFDYGPMWFICNLDKLPRPFYSYGKTWLAYDHKQGGEQE